jgi:hypothetical protein
MKLPKGLNKILKKMKLNKMLQNKLLLYVVAVVALIYVVQLLNERKNNMVAVFAITALLSTYFSKNMIVNLGIALIVTIAVGASNILQEGFEDKEENKDDKEDEEDEEEKPKKEGMKSKKSGKKAYFLNVDDECVEATPADCAEGECYTNNKCTEKFGQRSIPKSTPASVDGEKEKPGDRIDYASTLEMAYDNLQGMLGEGGMKGLTEETKKLVSQQQSLMESLKTMTPIMKSAKETLDNMELPDMKEMQGMLNKLKIGKK